MSVVEKSLLFLFKYNAVVNTTEVKVLTHLILQKSKELSSIYVADVLTKSVEYADDKGQFQKRIFKLDSAFISVRMDLLPATSVITLSRINDDLKKKVLTKTTIHK